jgi:hypothetical protein
MLPWAHSAPVYLRVRTSKYLPHLYIDPRSSPLGEEALVTVRRGGNAVEGASAKRSPAA